MRERSKRGKLLVSSSVQTAKRDKNRKNNDNILLRASKASEENILVKFFRAKV